MNKSRSANASASACVWSPGAAKEETLQQSLLLALHALMGGCAENLSHRPIVLAHHLQEALKMRGEQKPLL
jgi:hypothetical protein